MQTAKVWTNEDYLLGDCDASVVGRPRDAPTPVDELIDSLPDDKLTPATLRKEALKAFKQLGGAKYLLKNPVLLEKILVRMAGEAPPPAQQNTTVQVNVGWLSPNRLSYKNQIVDIAPAIAATQMIEQGAAK
jgi:hypothetical protein